jgi:hypothetical protein
MPKKRRKKAAETEPAAGKSSAMTAIMEYVKAHPKAPYKEVAEAVAKDGHKIYPIMFGRAQALLGFVPMKKRGKRAAGALATLDTTEPPAPTRKRGRPPKTAADPGDSLKTFLAEYEELRRDRDDLREALGNAYEAIRKAMK